jgi:alkylation response protein AidB-like acyl-CoA dehydrogenase
MIDFELGDDLELIQATARDFAADHLRPALREHEGARAVGAAARAAFADIGLATLEWPESQGGSGLGALARSLVLEELAAGDAGAALALDPLGPALYALLELGGEDALQRLGHPLLDGPGGRAGLAWNGTGTRSRLERRPDGVHGTVPWVPADRVDLLVVLDAEGAFAIVAGIPCEKLRGAGLRAAGASQLRLEAAPVVGEWRDAEAARRALARARLYVASLMLGVVREAAEFSRQYALERVAFGKPIAHHQALAFLIADMAAAVDTARLLIWEAAWRLDRGQDASEACAGAFTEAAEQAMFVTPNAVQILGGHGFMQDYPVEKLMREARALGLLLGGADAAREDAGRELAACGGRVPLTLEAV